MLAGGGGKLANERHGLTRREMLSLLAKGALTYPLATSGLFALARKTQSPSQAVPADWQLTSEELLEEIVSRAFLFFWNETGKRTGLVLSLIHISEPTRRTPISYAVFCLKKKK